MSDNLQVERRFIELVGGRNFIAFTELESQLGLTGSELIWLKSKLEDALRLHAGEKLYITSRMDLNVAGFEIGE